MGYRNVYLDPEEGVYFSISAETQVASRLESYFANTKSFFSKKDFNRHTNKAVGTFSCWKQTQETPLMADNYDIVFQCEFNSQAICMRIEKSLEIAAVGTDDGFLRVFEVNFVDLQKTSLKAERQVHKGRLMDLWIDVERELIFCIGEDKFIRSFCLKTGSVLGGRICSY